MARTSAVQRICPGRPRPPAGRPPPPACRTRRRRLEGHLADGQPDPERERLARRPSRGRRSPAGRPRPPPAPRPPSRNTTSSPSPVFLTSSPPRAATSLPQRAKCSSPQLVEGRLAQAAHQLGGPDQVGEQHRRRPARTPPPVHADRVVSRWWVGLGGPQSFVATKLGVRWTPPVDDDIAVLRRPGTSPAGHHGMSHRAGKTPGRQSPRNVDRSSGCLRRLRRLRGHAATLCRAATSPAAGGVKLARCHPPRW